MARSQTSKNEFLKYLLAVLVGLAAAYAFASLALDTASMWMYLFAFLSLWAVIKFTAKLIRIVFNGGHEAVKT